MSGRELRKLCELAVDAVRRQGFSMELVEYMPLGMGSTDDDGVPDHLRSVMGIGGLDDGASYDFGHSMQAVVGIFHEACGHASQARTEFNTVTDLGQVLALNHYACKASSSYYGVRDVRTSRGMHTKVTSQYFNQPNEIAAEYMGVKTAHAFLSYVFGPDVSNHMLCEYERYRESIGSSCLQKGTRFDSVDEMLELYDDAFRRNCVAKKSYGTVFNPVHEDDIIIQNYNSRSAKRYVAEVRDSDTGLRQDAILASMYARYGNNGFYIMRRPAVLAAGVKPTPPFEPLMDPPVSKDNVAGLTLADLRTYDDLFGDADDGLEL